MDTKIIINPKVTKKIYINTFPLFILFLILKLTNVITWSWWWVTAPLWIPMVLWLIGVITILFIFLIAAILSLGSH
jgi:hypothetical protein